MKLDKFQKAKVVLGINLLFLFLIILFVPHIIEENASWASEDTIETLFLVLGFFSLIYVFWHYDFVVQKREKETSQLSSKLQDKEKELLKTFQYLGKINVRFSVVEDLISNLNKPIPVNNEKLAEKFEDLLNIACGATGKDFAQLKIIDTKNKKVLIERREDGNTNKKKKKTSVSLKYLLDISNKKKVFQTKQLEVFCSELNNSNIKAFLFLPFDEENSGQGEDFLRAVVNQCVILFLVSNQQNNQANKKTE